MRWYLLVEEKNLLFRLIKNVIETEKFLERVLKRWLFSFRDRYLKGDWSVVEQVFLLVLELRS